MKDNTPLFDFDRELSARYGLIAGIDEAGRGPLCGPVSVACCIMPLDTKIDAIYDSKKVSEKHREELYALITSTAIAYSSVLVDAQTIDNINILNATKQAMRECMDTISKKPDLFVIDAVKLETPYRTMSVIRGDSTSYNVAAASIIAKVTRDRLMAEYDRLYPEYGFAENKGYGTARHIAALKEYGPCPIHRATFIKNFI